MRSRWPRHCNAATLFCVIFALMLVYPNIREPFVLCDYPHSDITSEASTSIASAGIFTENLAEELPVSRVRVRATVVDFFSKVSIKQVFHSSFKTPVEGIYIFPLYKSSTVSHFTFKINDKPAVTAAITKVQDKDRIGLDKDALRLGKKGMHFQKLSSDLFLWKMGKIQPGDIITVKITYISELHLRRGKIKLILPSSIIPSASVAQQLHKKPLTIKVDVQMSSEVSKISSPVHGVMTVLDGTKGTARFRSRHLQLQRDFMLNIACDGIYEPRVWMEEYKLEPNTTTKRPLAVVAVFPPKLHEKLRRFEVDRELLFVVDVSSGMSGVSIKQTRAAMNLLLKSLPGAKAAKTTIDFNIFAFSSVFKNGYQSLFKNSTEFTENSYKRAKVFVDKLSASGSAELLYPLQHISSSLPAATKHLRRSIIIITNAAGSSNMEGVLELVKKDTEFTRVFTIGIGSGKTKDLLHELAAAGGGVAEHVIPGEKVQPKVIRQLKRAILKQRFTNIKIKWHFKTKTNTTYELAFQTPEKLRDIHEGDRLLVYGILKDATSLAEIGHKSFVTIQAESEAKGLVTHMVSHKAMLHRAGRILHKLTAVSRLRQLSRTLSGYERVNQNTEDQAKLRTQITKICLSHMLLKAKYTIYSGKYEREEPQDVLDGILAAFDNKQTDIPVGLSKQAEVSYEGKIVSLNDALNVHHFKGDELAQLQEWAGAWKLTPEFARAVQLPIAVIQRARQEGCFNNLQTGATALQPTEDGGDVWATALGIAAYEASNTGDDDDYEFIIKKAKGWLNSNALGGKSRAQACIKTAHSLVDALYAHAPKASRPRIRKVVRLPSNKGNLNDLVKKVVDTVTKNIAAVPSPYASPMYTHSPTPEHTPATPVPSPTASPVYTHSPTPAHTPTTPVPSPPAAMYTHSPTPVHTPLTEQDKEITKKQEELKSLEELLKKKLEEIQLKEQALSNATQTITPAPEDPHKKGKEELKQKEVEAIRKRHEEHQKKKHEEIHAKGQDEEKKVKAEHIERSKQHREDEIAKQHREAAEKMKQEDESHRKANIEKAAADSKKLSAEQEELKKKESEEMRKRHEDRQKRAHEKIHAQSQEDEKKLKSQHVEEEKLAREKRKMAKHEKAVQELHKQDEDVRAKLKREDVKEALRQAVETSHKKKAADKHEEENVREEKIKSQHRESKDTTTSPSPSPVASPSPSK